MWGKSLRGFFQSTLIKGLSAAGIEAQFARKRHQVAWVTLDKKCLEPYFKQNERIRLYFEGLKRAGIEWSDDFFKQCRFYSLQQMVEFAARTALPTDVAECGCWTGHSSYIICKILREHGFQGEFHIFDSFEGGLSEKGPKDRNERYVQSPEDIQREKMIFASTEEQVRQTLAGFDFVKLYKGWIPSRFPEVQDRSFVFVHLDVDLYQPTLDSLEFFYPRLIEGGIIVVDDYGYTQFPGASRAVDEFLRENRCHMFYEPPLGSCFIIK